MYYTGIRSITIITYRFVDKKTGNISTTSRYDLAAPPKDREIITAIEEGKRLGMQVSLNPFIEIDNPNGIGHEWRGTLDFSGEDLKTFFDNYQDYIINMAKVADATEADRLYVGSELKVLLCNSKARTLWFQVIDEARRSFRKGILTYAANHDEYKNLPLWHQLDEIGIDAYFSLASRPQAAGIGNPTIGVIAANWKNILKRLKNFSEQQKKPVILSEWGVVPFDLTTYQPWNWKPSTTEDSLEQLNAYRATLAAVASQGNWLRGIQFWHWGMEGNLDSNYSIIPDSNLHQLIIQYLAKKEGWK